MSEKGYCTDCHMALGDQHRPSCHRQGAVTKSSLYQFGYCPAPDDLDRVITEVRDRRYTQDEKHGGPEHDDTHTRSEWLCFMHEWLAHATAWSDESSDAGQFESRCFDVAALAIAAIQSSRRKYVRDGRNNITESRPSTPPQAAGRTWKEDPKAVESLEYLLSIGMNADEFAREDADESGDVDDE